MISPKANNREKTGRRLFGNRGRPLFPFLPGFGFFFIRCCREGRFVVGRHEELNCECHPGGVSVGIMLLALSSRTGAGLLGAPLSQLGRAVMVVRMRRGSKLGNERCPDRQHAADADAGGSKNDPKPGKNGNSGHPLFAKSHLPVFSLLFLLEKLSKLDFGQFRQRPGERILQGKRIHRRRRGNVDDFAGALGRKEPPHHLNRAIEGAMQVGA